MQQQKYNRFLQKKAIESDKTKLNNWVKTELTKLVFQQLTIWLFSFERVIEIQNMKSNIILSLIYTNKYEIQNTWRGLDLPKWNLSTQTGKEQNPWIPFDFY